MQSVSSCKWTSQSKTSQKSENQSSRTNPKIKIVKISRSPQSSRTPKISQAGKKSTLKTTLFQGATKLPHNVGSYTQGRTAGDFLSSRKAARAERCTPETTAAGLAGSWCCSLVVLFSLIFFLFLFSVGDASPLQSQSNGQVRSVKAQKCRIEYCLFSLLPISVYILKTKFRVKWQKSVRCKMSQ